MPVIWKIKEKSFWFVGTLHVLKNEDCVLLNNLKDIINKVEILALEDKDFLVAGQNIGLYGKEKSILSELSFEAIGLLKNRCYDLGINFYQIENLRPWKAVFYLLFTYYNFIGYSINNGVDKYLLNVFQRKGMSIDSLENSEQTLLVFENIPLNYQEKFLLDSLSSIDEMKTDIENIYNAWKLGDGSFIEKFICNQFKKIPNLYEQLIIGRNLAWIDKICSIIDGKKSALIAVGVAHLFGESNIVDLLFERGYEIERLQ